MPVRILRGLFGSGHPDDVIDLETLPRGIVTPRIGAMLPDYTEP
jgi:hypothetical protein